MQAPGSPDRQSSPRKNTQADSPLGSPISPQRRAKRGLSNSPAALRERLKQEMREKAYTDECMRRRAKVETILLKDPVDRDEQDVERLSLILRKEFKFFKELERDTANEAKYLQNIVQHHLTMERTFEQKNLIEEGKFVNKDGVYMLFEGFCGIYQLKKTPLPKVDVFGKEIVDQPDTEEDAKEDTTSMLSPASSPTKRSHLDQVMLQDVKVGSFIGLESHLYDDCPALFTAKSNEKTKLLKIDKAGFNLYLKDYILARQRRILNFYQQAIFLKKTKQTFHGLLKLVLMSEYKPVFANTCVVNQGDLCKYLHFVVNGRFTVVRQVDFIEELTVPLEQQMTFLEGINRENQLQAARLELACQEPSEYRCTTSRKQLQIAHFGKGKIFGDYQFESDFELERRPGEIAEVKKREPYSIVTFNPAEIIHIERQIFAQIIEPEDLEEYSKFKTELPSDVILRRKFLQAIEWAKFKKLNKIASVQSP